MVTNNSSNLVGPGTTGQVVQSTGTGGQVYSTSVYPATNAQGDLAVGSAANVYSNIAKPSLYPGSRLIFDGTNLVWFNPSIHSYVEDDFLSNGQASQLNWSSITSGTGASLNTIKADNGHPGIIQLLTGSTNTGWAGLALGGNNANAGGVLVGGGSINQFWVFKIVQLSNSTATYIFRIGLTDDTTPVNPLPTNGIYFTYTDSATGAHFFANTTAGGVTTSTDTGVVAQSSTYVYFGINVNAAATSVAFSINNVVVATNTTNIPATTQSLRPYVNMLNTVGTGSGRIGLLDEFNQFINLTSPR